MSPTKIKSLLTGTLFAIIVIALSGSVMASDLRLFKPYTPETFGGGRRGHDGVYGSVSGIYWSISTPKGGYIGATTSNGQDERRWAWDAGTFAPQTNSVRIEMMSPTTTLGTRFEVGNRLGHHGWLISGYGLPSQGHRMNDQNVTLTIRDEGDLNYRLTDTRLFTVGNVILYVWDGKSTNPPVWQEVDITWHGGLPPSISGLGYLWGVFGYEVTDPGDETVGTGSFFAPLPIFFEEVAINVRSSHCSGELMYTYRPHPFTWGSMELLAGTRYWEFKDTFGFNGINGDGLPVVSPDLLPRSALMGMTVNAEGINRVFGPQFGMKLSRHNARWTFGAEGRFTAGINAQTVKTQGNLQPRTVSFAGTETTGVWGPLGLQNSNYNFGHKQTKTYFSPILEGKLTADWQWTSSVSFFGAVNGMFADNIARGYRTTDYVVKSDGTIFGIRGNDRNTHVFMYGVEAGIKINR